VIGKDVHPSFAGINPDTDENGAFTVAPAPDGKQIAVLFRHKVLTMLLAKGKITYRHITLMDN
jgi:hypothetical protein